MARSEIRAAKYSLECHNQYGAQLYEGNLEQPQLCSISQRFKQCVRDRATDSVRLVTGSHKARSIVDEVFEKSYSEDAMAAKEALEITHLEVTKYNLRVQKKANNNFCYIITVHQLLPQSITSCCRKF